MAKIRVYELAKELDVENKVILDYLNGKGIEAKTASSGIDDDVAADVRKGLKAESKPVAAPKAEATPKTEATPKADNKDKAKPEKKKNMTFVFNSQFASNGNKTNDRRPRPADKGASQSRPQQQANRGPIKPRNPGEVSGLRPSQRAAVVEEPIIIQEPVVEEPVKPVVEQVKQPAVEQVERKTADRPVDKNNNDRSSKNDRPNRDNRPSDKNNNQNKSSDRNNHDGKSFNKNNRSQDRPQNNGQGRADKNNKPGASAAPNQPSGNINKANNNRRDNGKKKNNYDNRDGGKNQENFINLEKNGGKKKHNNAPKAPERNEDEILNIKLPEHITIKDLSDRMKIASATVIKKLFLKGMMVTLNQEVDYEQAEEIALEFNCICEPEEKVDVIAELLKETDEDESKMVRRPPVVCVMGHVDHGKTSLLDAIRDTKVTAREAGGITQHIGAYTVEIDGQQITFLDTPGHEAFTAMRMRGAQSTDIAILVVAADDGVMPQTVEAINHAKAAGVEIIVAINKIDKPSANIDRVKQELSEYELIPEDWGGSTVFVPVSAHTKEGIDTLLEMILLTADVLELKANPKRLARGLVIEAQLDKGRGAVATVLVQKGTLHAGDPIACGSCYGKVRAMIDDTGERVKEAGPSIPVEIFGLSDVPSAGEIFMAMDSEKEAHAFADTFIAEGKNRMVEESRTKMSLDDLFSKIKEGNLKELNLIVKADVQGSVEAVKQSLVKLSNDEVAVKVIHGGVGAINESDIVLASASNAIIIGFNVRPDAQAKNTAEHEGVDVRLYKVIYDAINDVSDAMKGMLDPVYEEKVIGHAEVRQIFKASGIGNIAGSYILDGYFERNCSVRISREGEQIFEGKLASLKRFKDDVKEVKAGFECGLVIEDYQDFAELDVIEAYIMVEVPR